jgi:FkbM family methyltransferase
MFRQLRLRMRRRIRGALDKIRREIGPRRPPIYLGNNRALGYLLTGERIIVDTRDVSVAIHVLQSGIWESNVTRALFSLLRPDHVFFDLGANCGYFTILAASSMRRGTGHVYAFEANPALTELINLSAIVNGFNEIVTVENLAVGDKREKLTLHMIDNMWGSSSLRELPDASNACEVQCVDLDSYVREQGIPRVDLVKIDIEGFEDRAYHGMKRTACENESLKMVMEFSPTRYEHAEEFFGELCGDFEYRSAITRKGGFAPVRDYEHLLQLCSKTGAGQFVELVLSHSPL